MGKLLAVLTAQKRLWQQRQEIARLRAELDTLRAQNDSMRSGMRRCVTCEYNLHFKQRQDGAANTEATATIQADERQVKD